MGEVEVKRGKVRIGAKQQARLFFGPLPYAVEYDAEAQDNRMEAKDTPQAQRDNDLDAEEENLMSERDLEMEFQAVLDAMGHINLDDEVDTEHRITQSLVSEERSRLEFTAEDEKIILASVGEQTSPDLTDERIERSIANYRTHYFTILTNTIKFMFVMESTKSHIGVCREWMMFFIANATKACRERLLRLLTDSRFQPTSFQYILGSDHWTRDMMDDFPRLNINCFGPLNKHFASYVGVVHERHNEDHQTWVYKGSAIAFPNGEARRMLEGYRLESERGHDEIMSDCSSRWAQVDRMLREHWQNTDLLYLPYSTGIRILSEAGVDDNRGNSDIVLDSPERWVFEPEGDEEPFLLLEIDGSTTYKT
ncbi:hypothetical protein G7Y89_g10445 [Cudoniella acicularis]|uniref:Uncharacterized protein n=1 Tax=Cudoniella acicularis TaxID=354080 RepID=A0A8H4RFI8_9HELO|nr:hypothetical protein G7Y89_g10445 [Cudoniella acicularis]